MKHALHATAAYTVPGSDRGERTDQSRWSLLRLLVAAMLTIAVLAATTGFAA